MASRGIELKYNMTTKNLYIKIRFMRFTGVQQYQPYVEARGMLADAELDDLWPLHYDVMLDGCSIRSCNIRNRLVRLSDNRSIALTEAINILEQQI